MTHPTRTLSGDDVMEAFSYAQMSLREQEKRG